MPGFPVKRARLAIAAWFLLCASCVPFQTPSQGGTGSTLTDLRSIDDLQTRFNQDSGAPRLILVLSPT
jgi:hypothetical protein